MDDEDGGDVAEGSGDVDSQGVQTKKTTEIEHV